MTPSSIPSNVSCSAANRGSGKPFPSPTSQTGVMQNVKCHFLVGSPEAPPATKAQRVVGLSDIWGKGQPC